MMHPTALHVPSLAAHRFRRSHRSIQAALRWLPGKVWLWHSRRNAAFVIEMIRRDPALRTGLREGRLLLDLFDPSK